MGLSSLIGKLALFVHSGWGGVLEAVIECRFNTLKFCDCLAEAYDTLCFYYLFCVFFFILVWPQET